MRVLISGASVAGPTLAYWLTRYGHQVTVVERAPSVRPGGQAVDFKGETHWKVLQRTGILDEVQRRQTGRTDLNVVNEQGRRLATIPGEFTGGDVEILRGDLAAILYERTAADCEYLFGDSVLTLDETDVGVDVMFEHAAPRRFDLVVGADGMHSVVRRLSFGPESDYVHHLGHYYAVVGSTVDGSSAATERGVGTMYNVPGRMVTAGGSKAPSMFVFASEKLDYDRADTARQKEILTERYADLGWEVPRLLAALPEEPEFYLDAIARVAMDQYTAGRVALLGDAAYGNTLSGFGTGLALVGAYVLAGELALSDGDHRTAFARYDQMMHRYANVARKVNAGPFLAPPTPLRMTMRNWTFKFGPALKLMLKVTDRFATDIELPDYPVPAVGAPHPGAA